MRNFILCVLITAWANTAFAETDLPVACKVPWVRPKALVAALPDLEKSYESAKEHMASSDPRLAMSMITLSYALFSDRNMARAEPLFHAGLAQLAQTGTPADADMAQTLGYLAELAYCRQALDQAEKLYLHAIAIYEKLSLAKQLHASLRSLAGIFYRQGHFAKGEAAYARSETILLQLGGKPRPKENFGAKAQLVELIRKGDVAAAIAQAQSEVQKAEADQQASQENLAEISIKMAQANEAKPSIGASNSKANNAHLRLISDLQGRVQLAQKNVRNSQWRLGLALTTQAQLLHSQKQHSQAEPLYLRALGLMQQEAQEPRGQIVLVGEVLSDIGMLYRAQGENEKALSFQARALQMLLPWLGQAHPDVIESEQELAFLRKQLAATQTPKK